MAAQRKQKPAKALAHSSRAWLLCIGLLAARVAADTPDPALACDESPQSVRLHLRVSGLHSERGNITVTVYPDDAKRFLVPHGKLARLRAPAIQPSTSICLRLPAPGRYEIALYHDENNDHHFNRSWIGLPEEGYGFSNNPDTLTGLPTIEDARFSAAAGDTALDIRLRY